MEKQRLVVMNGQCIAQTLDEDNKWRDAKIEKAGARPAGIYNLYAATPAAPNKSSDGLIVHTDTHNVYQQVGKIIVKHAVEYFDKVPELGALTSITYSGSKAHSAPARVRGRSR